MEEPRSSSRTVRRPRSSRKRPRSTTVTWNAQHVCAGLVLLALLRCCPASQPGGIQGGPYDYSILPQGQAAADTVEIRQGVQWTYLPQAGSSREPRIVSQFVQRQDPMAAIRRLAVAMEGEDRAEVASYVATVLQELASTNELFVGERARRGTVFHSASTPSVSVAEFVERVANNMECPNLCLMMTMVYMDRLALPSSELHLYVTPLTAHRLFAASLIIAIKFVGVKPESIEGERLYQKMNSVTGLAQSELKHLEHHMLQALAKNAFVSGAEMKRYLVNFAPKGDELLPYVDRPYMGPPPFPFQ